MRRVVQSLNCQFLSYEVLAETTPTRFVQTDLKVLRATSELKEMDKLEKNDYYIKYADKISKLKKTQPDELEKKLEDLTRKYEAGHLKSKEPTTSSLFEANSVSKAVEHGKTESAVGGGDVIQSKKSLDSLMKVEMLEDLNASQIGDVWREYHKNQKNMLSAVIPAKTFDQMKVLLKKHRMFLLPLPRNEGHEFIVSEFCESDLSVHLTTLINYQTHGQNAPECLTLHHYYDLADSKYVVLMRGEFDDKILRSEEAQCLANQIELFYFNPNASRLELLETFTNQPSEFKHEKLIEQIQVVSLIQNSQSNEAT